MIRPSRREVAMVLAASLLLHVLALVGASLQMRVQPLAPQPAIQRHVIQVDLIEDPPEASPSPPPLVLPDLQVKAPAATTPVNTPRPMEPPPVTVPERPRQTVTAAELFDSQGEVVLSTQEPATAATAAGPEYQAGILHSDSRPAAPHSPVEYKATRFEKDWVPLDENIWETAARKTMREATVLKLPGGAKLKCVASPLTLGFGCGLAGPEQLSEPLKPEYTRNNLPSATPLSEPAKAGSSTAPATPASVPVPATTGD